MRREQAEALVARLEAAYSRGLDGDTKDIYIDRLMALPFATALKRIELLINTSKFMPKIAELMRPVEGEVGQLNANIEDKWADTMTGRYSLYRSDRLPRLDDVTYWEYLHDPATRARIENQWRHDFLHPKPEPRRGGKVGA